jgi:hypothetical protein
VLNSTKRWRGHHIRRKLCNPREDASDAGNARKK